MSDAGCPRRGKRGPHRRLPRKGVGFSSIGALHAAASASWKERTPPPLDQGLVMLQHRRSKRDKHALNADGMVLCNPRDREAAQRAEMALPRERFRHHSPPCMIPSMNALPMS
jgi:hypothetical protein